jgi:DNA-binding NtrC family response regulator
VRELRNAIERAVQFTDGPVLSADALPEHVKNPSVSRGSVAGGASSGEPVAPAVQPGEAPRIQVEVGGTYRDAKERVLAAFEESYVGWLLERHHHNVSAAARDADMDRKHLRRLMKKHEADTHIDD